MLKQRIITGFSLLFPVLGVVFYAPTPALYTLFSAAALLLAWEWTAMMGLTDTISRTAYLGLIAVLLGVAWLYRVHSEYVFLIAALGWARAACWLPGFPQNTEPRRPGAFGLGLIGVLIIVPAILAVGELHAREHGAWTLLYALVLVWAADVGAYFAGRAFGKRKLAPNVSPGKTIEGALGGLALSLVLALVSCPFVFGKPLTELGPVLVLSLIVGVISIVGDLTESAFKRMSGIKDSGSILPGHGGLLDRADSLLAALPVFAFGLYVLQVP